MDGALHRPEHERGSGQAFLVKRLFDRLRGTRVPPLGQFPDDWAEFVWTRCAHYRRLPSSLRPAFEQGVQRFIATQRMTGVRVPVDDPLRLLVASSAVTLSLAWPDYKWSEVSEVLLYPDSFDRDFRIGPPERAGMAHVWGTVILSIPALWHSFDHPDENYHVGLHEFAHLLTFEGGKNLAIPIGLRPQKIQEWEAIQTRELERIRCGDSIVEILGVVGNEEFFPSAVEAFFQQPLPLRDKHRDLYEFLSIYFDQDAAAWESDFREQTKDGAG